MLKSIAEIKNMFQALEAEKIPEALEALKEDPRAGVQKILSSYVRKHEQYIKEVQRLDQMSCYEQECYEQGQLYIAGLDEVGRGPLAGPVLACALILPKGCKIAGVDDSKKLSESKRNSLVQTIKEQAIDFGIGIVDVKTIDEINILQATRQAMRQAVQKLKVRPTCLLIDGHRVPEIGIFQKPIIQGDSKSISIAAASIVAKVTRDEMMYQYHEVFPAYGFDSNKGYGTEKHIEAIKEFGLCPLHRRTFVKNFI